MLAVSLAHPLLLTLWGCSLYTNTYTYVVGAETDVPERDCILPRNTAGGPIEVTPLGRLRMVREGEITASCDYGAHQLRIRAKNPHRIIIEGPNVITRSGVFYEVNVFDRDGNPLDIGTETDVSWYVPEGLRTLGRCNHGFCYSTRAVKVRPDPDTPEGDMEIRVRVSNHFAARKVHVDP